jgi:hypothetical protein
MCRASCYHADCARGNRGPRIMPHVVQPRRTKVGHVRLEHVSLWPRATVDAHLELFLRVLLTPFPGDQADIARGNDTHATTRHQDPADRE